MTADTCASPAPTSPAATASPASPANAAPAPAPTPGADIKIRVDPISSTQAKFVVSQAVYPGRSVFVNDRAKISGSVLLEKIFAESEVVAVLVAADTITVTRKESSDWVPLAKALGAAIRAAIGTGKTLILPDVQSALPPEATMKEMIEKLFDAEINPAIAAHGGYVELIDVKDNNVYVKLGGGCQGCGAAPITLKTGIEASIRKLLPGVGEILDSTDHASGRNPYYAPSGK